LNNRPSIRGLEIASFASICGSSALLGAGLWLWRHGGFPDHYRATYSLLQFGSFLVTASLGLAFATTMLRLPNIQRALESAQESSRPGRADRVVREFYVAALIVYSMNWLFDTLILKTTNIYGPEFNALGFVEVHLLILYPRALLISKYGYASACMFIFGALVFATGIIAILKPRSRALLVLSVFVLLAATVAARALEPLGMMALESASAMFYSVLPGVGFYLLAVCIALEMCGAVVGRLAEGRPS
jgi:hypothetical protein